jgi:hypothetical protein
VGVSTSHCVYATCGDATDSFRVIVPREAVGQPQEVATYDRDDFSKCTIQSPL